MAVKPKLNGDGRGVVERFCNVDPDCTCPWVGRVPIGVTPAGVVAFTLSRGGDPPVGDEVEVRLDC